ncbi:hypothetical protein E2C01_049645 [Portunus trituberculatus]|uniref:Uncharacterized protein n=1 Tax=Portunus trituberculatus TaxID=210409 RepID=A0A5B7G6Y3_PORTR|nr:hypothetical protein [Portunus trituberculatus]
MAARQCYNYGKRHSVDKTLCPAFTPKCGVCGNWGPLQENVKDSQDARDRYTSEQCYYQCSNSEL